MGDDALIRTLRERVDLLEEENLQLRELVRVNWRSPVCLGLTRTEENLIGILMSGAVVPIPTVMARLYGLDHDRCRQLIYVHLAHIRRKLRPYGMTVDTLPGKGLNLSSFTRGTIKHLLALEDRREDALAS